MKILLTGSDGFIGGNLYSNFKSLGYNIVGLENNLLNFEDIKNEVLSKKPNIVIHTASLTEVEHSFDRFLDFSSVNYNSTVNLIESCSLLDNFDLFLHSSTMEVYGWQKESEYVLNNEFNKLSPFDEKTPPKPNAPYAVAKIACEYYLEYINRTKDFSYVTLRKTNTYGRENNSFFIMERILSQLMDNTIEKVYLGDPRPFRNFIYIDDLVECYRKILENINIVKNDIYCVGPNNALSINELYNICCKTLDIYKEPVWYSKPVRTGEVFYLNSIETKINSKIDWKPTTSLVEGIQKTKHELERNYDGSW